MSAVPPPVPAADPWRIDSFTGEQLTPGGRFLVHGRGDEYTPPHTCSLPYVEDTAIRRRGMPDSLPTHKANSGAVWRCDCGQCWEAVDVGGEYAWWETISKYRAGKQIARRARYPR